MLILIKIMGVIGAQLIISSVLMLFNKIDRLPYYVQRTLIFILSTIGCFLVTLVWWYTYGKELIELAIMFLIGSGVSLILSIIENFRNRGYKEEVIEIPAGEYEINDVFYPHSSKKFQCRLFYKSNCYMIMGTRPPDNKDLRVYSIKKLGDNVFQAYYKVNSKDKHWSVKNRIIWLHSKIMLILWYSLPIIVAIERFDILRNAAIMAYFGLSVEFFKNDKNWLYKILFIFSVVMEAFLWFSLVFYLIIGE